MTNEKKNLLERTEEINSVEEFVSVYGEVKALIEDTSTLVAMVENINSWLNENELPFDVSPLDMKKMKQPRKRAVSTTDKEKRLAVWRAIADTETKTNISTSDIKDEVNKNLGAELNPGARADVYKWLIDQKVLKVTDENAAPRNRTYDVIGGQKGIDKGFKAIE